MVFCPVVQYNLVRLMLDYVEDLIAIPKDLVEMMMDRKLNTFLSETRRERRRPNTGCAGANDNTA